MKLSRSDALVSTGVLLGVVGLLWLFFIDIGSFAFRGNIQPLGTVVFKRMSATRRPSNALGWERVRNDSPVYNADTLRTGGLSEAAIYFDDGTSLELGANSMLRLDFGGPERNLEFLDGEITVGGSSTGSSYVISSLAGTITVGAESSATFSRDSEQNVVGVEVTRGTASLTRADGSVQTVEENQLLEVNAADGSSRFVSRPIVPLSPERNARVFVVSDVSLRGSDSRTRGNELVGTAYPLEFSWLLENADGGAVATGGAAATAATAPTGGTDAPGGELSASAAAPRFTLELSESKNFSGNTLEYVVSGLRASVPVAPGTWFWRVRDEAGQLSGVRKFSVDVGSFPRPAFPNEGSLYRYRRKTPEIRFAWTTMKEATAYIFELSDSAGFEKPNMRTRVSGSNFSVSDIGEGKWYWRVTPVHGYSKVQGAEIPALRSFVVEKSGAMAALDLSTPFEGHLYQIQEIDEKGLGFAWLPEPEAVSYELLVSTGIDLSNPIVIVPSINSYSKISSSDAGVLSRAGNRYWGVRWIDSEGNKSPVSTARKIVGIDGSIAMRPVFPPDGYRIADSLASNVRYTWKSNVAAPTVFLLARDPDFKDIVYQEPVVSETIIGKAWDTGTWYWKIRSFNTDKSVFMETPTRTVSIVGPLPETTLRKPVPDTLFYLLAGDSLSLEWNPVPGADYYTLALYSAQDDYSKPVFERAHIDETSATIAFGSFPSGQYTVRIQGLASETPVSTRIIGYISESRLRYKRLEYLQLVSPENGAVVGNIDAFRNGVSLRYQTDTMPETQVFRLMRKEPDGVKEVTQSSKRSDTFVAKKLRSGIYFWTIEGQVAGIDISAKESWQFEVLPVPPLPPTVIILPKNGSVFGPNELRVNRTIEFVWQPVPEATHYSLSLYSAGLKTPSFIKNDLTKTSFVLSDLSILSRGINTVQVEAICNQEGESERFGTPVQRPFMVDIPPPKPVESKTGSTLYGR